MSVSKEGLLQVADQVEEALKRAVVALSADGDIVSSVAGKKLKFYAYAIQGRADSMTCQFRDGAVGSFLTLRWGFNSREGVAPPVSEPPIFLFQTTAGNALRAVITGSGTVDIEVSYWESD